MTDVQLDACRRHSARLLRSAAQLQGLQRLSHTQLHVSHPWCQKVALAAAAPSPADG